MASLHPLAYAPAYRDSSSREAPSATIDTLLLCSPVRSIDNILLNQEFQRQLHQSCQLISHLSQASQPNRSLLLIDCSEVAAVDIQTWLSNHRHTQAQCALLNLQTAQGGHHHPYEHLMEWPQVKGMFYRQHSRQLLLRGISAIARGDLWLPRHLSNDFLQRRRRAPRGQPLQRLISPLTPREQQVLQGIYAGDTNAQMAEQMRLSEHTIKSHLYTAYKKLNVKSRLEASNWLRDHINLLD